MNISEFCIRRPVFTTLLMAALLVAGVAGYRTLAVSALPRVDFPTIQVSASLSGASPETMAASVATPLERQFSTISGITSMTSTSTLGSTSITLQFDLSRNIDGAALDVQTALSTAMRRLPKEMTTPPSFRKVNPADSPILFIGVSSDTLPLSQVDEYADTLMAQRISMVPGVAQAVIYGEHKYAVRIQVDPNKLAAQGLGFNQIQQAVADAASNAPMGTIYGPQQLFNIAVDGQPQNAAGFRNLIAVWKNGAPIRLGDIGKVIDGVQDTHQAGFLNGKPSIVIAIQRQPDANTIDVVRRVRALLPQIKEEVPASIQIMPMFDRSVAINNSVFDVQMTLLITFGLVIAVIFMFLGSLRATIIPVLAVPLSIIATFAGMAALDFSIDNISLLAITLCVGFVVDDAIVMMENIVRYIEKGMKPLEAALKGSKEISFTIISMTCSLIAVFIPVLFMGGIVGRLFREFAVTISIAVLFSGLISLTLTPMLCGRFLKAGVAHEGRFFRKVLAAYDSALRFVFRVRFAVLLLTFATLGLSVWLYVAAPKGFIPEEDTGFISISTEAAQDISYDAMLKKQVEAAKIIQADPAVASVFSAMGGGRRSLNAGRMFVGLKPKSQRPSMGKVVEELSRKLAKMEGFKVYMRPVQNIHIGGHQSKSEYIYTLQSGNLDQLYDWSNKMKDAIAADPIFRDVNTDLELKSLQAVVTVDQKKAASMGVTFDDVRRALYSAYGSGQVASLYTASNDYEVIMEVAPQYQKSIDDIGQIYVSGSAAGGKVVPLNAIATFSRGLASLSVNHQGQSPAVDLSFNLAPGVSLSDVVTHINAIRHKLKVPDSVTGSFQGTAQAFEESEKGQVFLLLVTVVVIYIILGMLYESFIHPITILSGLPSAGVGAIITLLLFGMNINVISVIGIVLLIGLVKKNAIMMVDFAINARAEGKSALDSIHEACLLRFRPIMMTTMAAIFGTLPIAIGIGDGAELRQPLGVAVVGGLLVSQLLTLFITPVIYLYLENLASRLKGVRGVPA